MPFNDGQTESQEVLRKELHFTKEEVIDMFRHAHS
jgi:hypothetical protein